MEGKSESEFPPDNGILPREFVPPSDMTAVNNNMTGAVCCGWLLLWLFFQIFLGQLGAHLLHRGHPNEEKR